MPNDVGVETLSRPRPPAAPPQPAAGRRELLPSLESAAGGRRGADGTMSVRRRDPAGCVLYGPYLQLPAGRYRLDFACHCGPARLAAQPVLGVEVIVLSRFQLAWRDYTAAELAAGTGALDFAVPPEHGLGSGNESRFEFRFFHLGNAGFAIPRVSLAPSAEEPLATAPRWRLLGRLEQGRIGRRRTDGAVAVRRRERAACLLYGGWPYLRLPLGSYRLCIRGRAGPAGSGAEPGLHVEVFGQSRWRVRRRFWQRAAPAPRGVRLGAGSLTAGELAAGDAGIGFVVPPELALEAGADAPLDIRIHHCAGADLTIEAVDVVPVPATAALAAPRLSPAGRRRIVMVGNCQMETLRQGFAQIDTLGRRFEVKYHFVQLPAQLREFAARDLANCDVVLAQDIRLWDEFALRDCVRPGADILRVPLVRLASPWPFDGWNGPTDRAAHDRETPNLTFPYLDGLLGRLRHDIPDREARFRAYRALELPAGLPGVVNYRRLHQLEERRLAAMDRQFGVAIGAYILENFRKRRVFHTTVRPNWQVFTALLQYLAHQLGVGERVVLAKSADRLLRNPQVPVHPAVARDLGVRWADERTRYLYRGQEITWEAYIRRYIAHYG